MTPTWTDDGTTIVTNTGITFSADAAAFVRDLGNQLQSAQAIVSDLTTQVDTLQAQVATLQAQVVALTPVAPTASEPTPPADPTPVVETAPTPATDPTPVLAPVDPTTAPTVDPQSILDWIAALRDKVEADIAALGSSVDERFRIVNASLGGILDRVTTLENANTAMESAIEQVPNVTIARIRADLGSAA